MKIRRKKTVQRVLSFFKNNFDFHPPYRVVVDGTFCQAALKNKVNIEDQIPRYFGSEVRFSTTSCAINETEILGKQFCKLICSLSLTVMLVFNRACSTWSNVDRQKVPSDKLWA